MKNYSVVISTAFALFALIIVGCAIPPDQELKTAKASLDSAIAVQADTYAPSDYKKAKDSLDSATAEIEKQNVASPLKQNYDKAKALLVSATAAANIAKAKAAEGKKQASAQADAALTNANSLLTGVKEMAVKMPKGKDGSVVIKDEIATIETAFGEAQSAKSSGDYFVALGKANSCSAKLDSLRNVAAAVVGKIQPNGNKK